MGTPLCSLNARLGDTIRVTRSYNVNLHDGDTLFVHENDTGRAYVYIAGGFTYLSSLRKTEGEIVGNFRDVFVHHTVEDTGNPKDRIGITKPDYSCVPMSPIYELGRAMQNGADKYGAFNWREHDVRADVYINAARRHLDQWAAGDEVASDSKVHHLAHAMACMAILFDAQRTGNLIDNRHKDKALVEYIKEMTELGSEHH